MLKRLQSDYDISFRYTLKCIFTDNDCVDILWILPPINCIESIFEGDLLIANMNRRNDYSEGNLFQCSFGYLTVVLRHT